MAKAKNKAQVGDIVEVRVFRWDGSFTNGNVDARETWLTAAINRIDEGKVRLFIPEQAADGMREYPFDSPDWRMAR